MRRYVLAVCFLTGCASQPQTLTGPAVQAALALPPVQFTAMLGLAQQVAQGCSTYQYSTKFQDAIIGARGIGGVGNRSGVDVELDVSRRSFQAKHDLTLGQDNTCTAIAAEIAEGTAISALLVSI